MVLIKVQTLILSSAPTPSVIILQPVEHCAYEGKSRIIPIWMGFNEATQISTALEKKHFSRPMTHGLFLDTLTNLDAYIEHVIINSVKGLTFYSQIILRQHNRLITLDARPSDSLSLAIRQTSPIYITDTVLEKASFPSITRNSSFYYDQTIEAFHRFIKSINPSDFYE